MELWAVENHVTRVITDFGLAFGMEVVIT